MPLRSLPFSASLTQANDIIHYAFVRVDVASPIGTKRFTDMPGGLTANIDGAGSLPWSEDAVMAGALDQSDQDTMKVSWLKFANLPESPATVGKWTTWANSPGLRNAPIFVYDAWFNINADLSIGSLAGALLLYQGKIDNHELLEVATLALKPFATPWTREVPWVTGLNLGAAALLPKQDTTVQWGSTLANNHGGSGYGQGYIATYPPPESKGRIVGRH